MFVECPVRQCWLIVSLKSTDAAVLRQCLQTGRYSLFDEQEVQKSRADNRQRLKWTKSQADSTKETADGSTTPMSKQVKSQRLVYKVSEPSLNLKIFGRFAQVAQSIESMSNHDIRGLFQLGLLVVLQTSGVLVRVGRL